MTAHRFTVRSAAESLADVEPQSRPGPLSEPEVRALVSSVLLGAAGDGVPEPELERILAWADDARVASTLLDLVLDGRAAVRWPEGDDQPSFTRPHRGHR